MSPLRWLLRAILRVGDGEREHKARDIAEAKSRSDDTLRRAHRVLAMERLEGYKRGWPR